MPDRKGDSTANEETVLDTPLHAYKEGRKNGNIDDEDSAKLGPPAHEKR